MLQALLADRFKLVAHTETRNLPVYALVVGKGGVRMKETTGAARAEYHLTVSGRNYRVVSNAATADDIVSAVANSFPDRPVIDRTGLTGRYVLDLTYTPTIRSNSEPSPEDITIFTAVREQLGLRLNPTTAPVSVMVVDHIEKPSAN
jgi:uncharacterized protein (TIGR03435 family)